MKITVETLVDAPIEAVWHAWTMPEDIGQWNTASEDWHTTKASDVRCHDRSCDRLVDLNSRSLPMLVNRAADRTWKATDYPGIERCLFRNNETGGRSSVVRLLAGVRFPRHRHEGSEEVVVLSGTVRIGGVELGAGDYLFTGPGEEHDVVAVSDASIFVSSQKATPLVE